VPPIIAAVTPAFNDLLTVPIAGTVAEVAAVTGLLGGSLVELAYV
jgi:hypothetical protein